MKKLNIKMPHPMPDDYHIEMEVDISRAKLIIYVKLKLK